MNKKPFFSIIIPVYNVENYLSKCLDSLLEQNFQDFELIAINDGSTDASKQILEQYENKFSNIKIIHQSNKGQGDARNVGIKQAKGDYLWCIDSDDWITVDSLSFLQKEIQLSSYKIDGLIFTCNVLDIEVEENKPRTEHKSSGLSDEVNEGYYSSSQALTMLFNNDIIPLCCSKVFSKDIYTKSNFEFIPGIFFEDIPFNSSLITSCHNIKIVKKDLYNYNLRQESTMVSKCTKKHVLSIFIALDDAIKRLKQDGVFANFELLFPQFYWYQLTFIYLKFVHNCVENDKYLLFIKELNESTKKLDVNFYIPAEKDPEEFPFAALLKSLFEHPLYQEEMEEEIFGSFNFPEEFVDKYM